jgi:hypothetical protein
LYRWFVDSVRSFFHVADVDNRTCLCVHCDGARDYVASATCLIKVITPEIIPDLAAASTTHMSLSPESFDRNEWLRQVQEEQERSQWLDIARQRLRWGAFTRVRKVCEHHFCDLTQTRCCACIDNRPERASYLRYVDGRGMVAGAKRWNDYCPGCKFHYSIEDAAREEEEAAANQREAMQMTTCVSCGEAGHAIWECPRELEEDSPSSQPSVNSDNISGITIAEPSNETLPTVMEQPSSSTGDSRALPSLLSIFRGDSSLSPSTTVPSSPSRSQNDSPRLLSPPRPMPRLVSHQIRRDRIRANFERSFGTMSEIANDPNYVSPIASLYGNAYARFQEREREREILAGEQLPRAEDIERYRQRLARQRHEQEEAQLERMFRSRSSSGHLDMAPVSSPIIRSSQSPRRPVDTDTHAVLEQLRRQLAEDDRRLLENSLEASNRSESPELQTSTTYLRRQSIFGQLYGPDLEIGLRSLRHGNHNIPPPPPRPKTPEALTKEDLMISNECKICFSQHCDTLLLPCAHLALCEVISLSTLLTSSGVQRRLILISMAGALKTFV